MTAQSTQAQREHEKAVTSAANSIGNNHLVVSQQQSLQQQQQHQPPVMALQSSPSLMEHQGQINSSQSHNSQDTSDGGQGRYRVVHQIQNPTYLQPYSQGQMLLPGNITLHSGINPQQFQVIAAGKSFPSGQIAPHMLPAAQGKQMLQAGQTSSFPGYTTIPAISSSQNQAIFFAPLNVMTSPQRLQTQQQTPDQSKLGELQKTPVDNQKILSPRVNTEGVNTTPGSNQNNQQAVLDNQPNMQIFNSLQAGGQVVQWLSGPLPQLWTNEIPHYLTANPIFIRSNSGQLDEMQGMSVQQSPTIPNSSLSGIQPVMQLQPHTTSTVPQQLQTQIMMNKRGSRRGRPAKRAHAPQIAMRQDVVNETNEQPSTVKKEQMTAMIQEKDQQQKQQQTPVLIQQHQQQTPTYFQQQNRNQHMQPKSLQDMMFPNMQKAEMPAVSMNQEMSASSLPQSVPVVQQLNSPTATTPTGAIIGQLAPTIPGVPLNSLVSQQMLLQSQAIGSNALQSNDHIRTVNPATKYFHQMSLSRQQMNSIQSPRNFLKPQNSPVQVSRAISYQENSYSNRWRMPQLTQETQRLPLETSHQPQSILRQQIQEQTMETNQAQIRPNIDSNTPLKAVSVESMKIEKVAKKLVYAPTQNDTSMQANLGPTQSIDDSVVDNNEDDQEMNMIQDMTDISSTQAEPKPKILEQLLIKTSPPESKPTKTGLLQEKSTEKLLPQAKVKPNVLTHVIEGFVIQEAAEPFAVSKPDYDLASEKLDLCTNMALHKDPQKEDFIEIDTKLKKNHLNSNKDSLKSLSPEPIVIMLSSVSNSESSSPIEHNNAIVSPNMSDKSHLNRVQSGACQWSVSEVCDFIEKIPGCAMYANHFLTQEIDGEALVLIKPEHLVMSMAMKLGPALKIVKEIDSLRPNKALKNKESLDSTDDDFDISSQEEKI